MIKRIITDEEMISATALVRESMLRTLPEPENCTGAFSAQFEEKIKKLKKMAERKAAWRRFAKGAVAAMLFVLIGFSMLFAFSTETRAAVTGWFKEQLGVVTTYWTDANENTTLPTYEPTWIPDGYEVVQEENNGDVKLTVYQFGDDITNGFIIGYWIATEDSKLFLDTMGDDYDIEQVTVHGYNGEFYIAQDPDNSSDLLWLDERTNTIITVSGFYDKVDILRIANGIRLVD